MAGKGRSSSADAGAKAMTASMCFSFSVGKSARISSGRPPSARLANTERTVTRVPLITGWPPEICESRTMKSTEVWSLTDAKTLSVTSTRQGPDGDVKSNMVYEKK